MAKGRILLIEDKREILEGVIPPLEAQGYSVFQASSGEQGLVLASTASPDLMILDIQLPEMNGLDVFRQLRQSEMIRHLPVILLTSLTEETDVVLGLELGVDDCVTKPISPKILVARIRSLLRKKEDQGEFPGSPVIEVSGLSLDRDQHRVTVEGREVNLSGTAFSILELLISHPGRVFSRTALIEAVQGGPSPVTLRSVDVHMVGLRKMLGPQGRQIETIRGFGYRLKALE